MSKQPKSQFQVTTSKIPKSEESPAQFKGFPISWQISQIDENGRWGLNIIKDHFKFINTEFLLNELSTSVHNDLYDALNDFNGKVFKSLNDFLHRLHIECNNNISSIEQKTIIKFIQETIFWTDVFPKLKNFETKTWLELEKEQFGGKGKSKHHSVKITDINHEAQKRLAQLKLDDIEELFSIRLSGTFRIWGVRKYSYLRILWFDPYHEICPSDLD